MQTAAVNSVTMKRGDPGSQREMKMNSFGSEKPLSQVTLSASHICKVIPLHIILMKTHFMHYESGCLCPQCTKRYLSKEKKSGSVAGVRADMLKV